MARSWDGTPLLGHAPPQSTHPSFCPYGLTWLQRECGKILVKMWYVSGCCCTCWDSSWAVWCFVLHFRAIRYPRHGGFRYNEVVTVWKMSTDRKLLFNMDTNYVEITFLHFIVSYVKIQQTGYGIFTCWSHKKISWQIQRKQKKKNNFWVRMKQSLKIQIFTFRW